MGFSSNAVTLTRYKVIDSLPQDFWNWAHERVLEYVFQERDGLDEYRAGWTHFDRPFQTDISSLTSPLRGFLCWACAWMSAVCLLRCSKNTAPWKKNG